MMAVTIGIFYLISCRFVFHLLSIVVMIRIQRPDCKLPRALEISYVKISEDWSKVVSPSTSRSAATEIESELSSNDKLNEEYKELFLKIE